MRRAFWLVVAVLVLAALPLVRAEGLLPLAWAEDHYLDLSKTDSSRTTALVDTASPGLVVLPRGWGSVALHPSEMVLVAAGSGFLRGYGFDGSRLVRVPSLDASFPGVLAAAFSSDGRYLAALSSSGELRVWGRASGGSLRQLASLGGFSSATGVESGPGPGFWVVGPSRVALVAFDGSSWREVPSLSVSPGGEAASYYAPRGSLLVLHGSQVRWYGFDGSRYREVASFGASEPGAVGLVQHGLGYGVVVGSRVKAYGLGPSGSLRLPSLDVLLPEEGLGGAVSLWGERDFVVLTRWGARYCAWSGSGWVLDPARSLAGVVGGYVSPAEYRSLVFPAALPVDRVRLEAEYQVPSGCGVVFQVSGDGGSTWTEVVPFENLDVPAGDSLCYRLLLSSSDPGSTPSVDRVRLFQIGRYSVAVRVRLIR